MINLLENRELVNEEIPWNSVKLRRLDPDIIIDDPRSLYSRGVFNTPMLKDGRPAFFSGDEVEIQWRNFTKTAPFGWWKGIVASTYMNPELLFPTDSLLEAPNNRFAPDIEAGILVRFPHFPQNSPWSFMTCSMFGCELESVLGFIGGIRHIKCQHHKEAWESLFPESLRNALIEHRSANLVPDDDSNNENDGTNNDNELVEDIDDTDHE